MKLTNTMREAFIRAAMDDVPYVDYSEQIQSVAQKAAAAMLPLEVRKLWDDNKLRPYVSTFYFRGAMLPGAGADDDKIRAAAEIAVAPFIKARDAQKAARGDLERKLRSVAYGATTRAALIEALPEFEKYLPVDVRTANLPAIANVVAEFVAAGWPKGKEPATKKPATKKA